MSLKQNNDQEILVPITDETNQAVNVSALTDAIYKVFSRDRATTLISKTLSSGITRSANELKISISKTDCAALRGTYYHELAVVDPVKGQSTVFNQPIFFEATEI